MYFISSMLVWSSVFCIALNIGSWWTLILGRRWISKFDIIFEKYSLKFSLALFRLLQLSHFQLTLFSRQNCLLSVTRLTSRFLKKYFLVFRSSLTEIFRCFLYAACDFIVLSYLNLFNNLDLVMIAFLKFLFTNAAWLPLTCFSFSSARLSNIYWAVALKNQDVWFERLLIVIRS